MSSQACETASSSALLRLQNMLVLLKDLNLSHNVVLKVCFGAMLPCRESVLRIDEFKLFLRRQSLQVLKREGGSPREYLVIVHVRSDSVFSKYFKNASGADMALFRGMFLKLGIQDSDDEPGSKCITSAAVHQAFLPKFENETQDAEIAASIQRSSGERYMSVSVKHSGSLATMSHDLLGAKNSQGNIYTAVACLLLHAHYERAAATDKCAILSHMYTRLVPCSSAWALWR